MWVLLLASVIPWRFETFYTGGLDPVVVAKAALDGVALLIAFFVLGDASRRPVRALPLLLVAGYLAVGVLGAAASGSPVASATLAVRVLLLAGTLALLVSGASPWSTIRGLYGGLVVVSSVVAVTSIDSFLRTGRLGYVLQPGVSADSAGLLPVNPNLISMMFGAVLLVLFARRLGGERSSRSVGLALIVLGGIWITGSRTGLAALAVAAVVMVVSSRRGRGTAVFGGLVALPLVFYMVASEGVVSAYFSRGGSNNIATLSSRTIAWKAAFQEPYNFWGFWFGRGLAAKTVGVSGTFWDRQVLDSSWVSAFVQAGVIGTLVLAVWVGVTLVAAMRAPSTLRPLLTAMTVFCLTWSVTATGLLDSFVLFLLMLTTSLLATATAARSPYPET